MVIDVRFDYCVSRSIRAVDSQFEVLGSVDLQLPDTVVRIPFEFHPALNEST